MTALLAGVQSPGLQLVQELCQPCTGQPQLPERAPEGSLLSLPPHVPVQRVLDALCKRPLHAIGLERLAGSSKGAEKPDPGRIEASWIHRVQDSHVSENLHRQAGSGQNWPQKSACKERSYR